MSSHYEFAQGFDAGHRQHTIQKLPPDAIAQIKSSIAINSINDVVLGLLKNSLDACPSKVHINLDFRRGSCSVEDDGLGIEPAEFATNGGLAKLHHTSKRHVLSDDFGSDGVFLASLSALSFLSITSRHQGYRSVNRLILHSSKCLSRSPPTETPYALAFGQHGTSVSVKDLFGNMPVRVKQRTDFENRAELGKLCDMLKRGVISVMVASRQTVDLKIQHADIGEILHLRKRSSDSSSSTPDNKTALQRDSVTIQRCLSILIDAKLMQPDSRRSWVPVSASTESTTVKGAISSEPAASRAVQFISVGKRPLSQGHTELFDLINKLFRDSDFGSIQDETAIDGTQLEHMVKDRRQQSGIGSRAQSRSGRKGIERWPMFLFYVDLALADRKMIQDAQNLSDGIILEITEVLTAMVMQWLSAQGHRPEKRRPLPSNSNSSSSSPNKLPLSRTHAADTSDDSQSYTRIRSFNELSKIKSGSASFYDTAWSLKAPFRLGCGSARSGCEEVCDTRSPANTADLHEPLESHGLPMDVEAMSGERTSIWQDPWTKEEYSLNARTGSVVQRPHNEGPFAVPQDLSYTRQQASRHSRSSEGLSFDASATPSHGKDRERPRSLGWLPTWLKSRDSSVFRMPEHRITVAVLPPSKVDGSGHCMPQSQRLGAELGATQYNEAFTVVSSRLSKLGLQRTRIIAQVDGKFILARMPRSVESSSESPVPDAEDMLVLIDQHAADERVKVESLLAELCSPPAHSESSHRSRLGHQCRFEYTFLSKPISFTVPEDEVVLFKLYAAHFASWSLLYDIHDLVVKVTALPPVVAERLKTSPQLLIKLLRSEIHALDRRTGPTSAAVVAPSASMADQPSWLRLTGHCPSGLLDLVNSRACRSAVMFNDKLTLEECEHLVKQLSRCVFPFVCAHGRPSMVPIVGIGSGFTDDDGPSTGPMDEGYASAFSRWMATEKGRSAEK